MIPLPKLSRSASLADVVSALSAWAPQLIRGLVEPYAPRKVTGPTNLAPGDIVEVLKETSVALPPAQLSTGRSILITSEVAYAVTCAKGKVNGALAMVGGPGLTRFDSDGVNWWATVSGSRLLVLTAFGAIGNGSDATMALRRAMDRANALYQEDGIERTVYVPDGRYGIHPSNFSSYSMPLLGSTAEVHVGVYLRSGVTIECAPGAEFVAIPPSGAQSGWHYALFGTEALNPNVGALERVRFIRPRFDFSSAHWTTSHTSLYSIIAVGVDDLEIQSPAWVCSSAANLGRGAKILNSKNVRVTDIRGSNITQALFMAYCEDLDFSGRVDDFVEAFDIDAPCYRVRGDVVCTNGTGEGQCLDISSVQDGHFRLQCKNVGNAAIIYQKPDGHPDFATWVVAMPADTDATNPVFCKRVFLDVRGEDIHGDDLRALQVSLDRGDSGAYGTYWDGKGILEDITIRADLTDTDPLLVYECKNLDLDATLRTVTTGTVDKVNRHAVILRQITDTTTQITESMLTGRARVLVQNSTRTGVRVACPTDFVLEATVDGYNSAHDSGQGVESGVYVSDLGRKGGAVTIKNIHVRNGDTTVTPADLRLGMDGTTGKTWVYDAGGHRLETSGAIHVVVTDGSHLLANRTIPPVSIDTTAAATVDTYLGAVGAGDARVGCVNVTNLTAISANATNYTSLQVIRIRAGTETGCGAIDYDNATRAAGTVVNVGVEGDEAGGVLTEGDVLAVRATRNGTGSALTGLFFSWALVEHSS